MDEESTYKSCQGAVRASCTPREGKLGAKGANNIDCVGNSPTKHSPTAQELVKHSSGKSYQSCSGHWVKAIKSGRSEVKPGNPKNNSGANPHPAQLREGAESSAGA